MSQTSIARSLFTVGLLLGALGCSAGEESTPARTGHTLASVAAGTDNQAAAARTLKPDNQSALDRVAESIRSSYTRTTGGQVEQLVPILRDGLGAASDTAKPMGLGYDSGKGKYRSWLYTYAQTLAGLPVYGASLRIVVQDQPTNPAVWVSSTLRNLGSFTVKPGVQAPAVDSQEARQRLTERASAEGTARLPSPTRFGQPSLVIYAGDRDQPLPPRLATQYLAESDTPVGAWLVIADVDTGEVLHSHSTISAADVPGQVTMLVTPNDLGEYCSLVASTPMPYAKVGITDGAQVFADANGQFTIPNSGTSPVEVVSSLEGEYFLVRDQRDSGQNEVLTQSVTPPARADFVHNWNDRGLGDSGAIRSEANAYLAANKVRDFYVAYDPDVTFIGGETGFVLMVNWDASRCDSDAWYQAYPGTIPLYTINTCVSTEWLFQDGSVVFEASGAFGDVIFHEYTHHVIDVTHPGWPDDQGPYGEGMGDAVGSLITGRPQHGLGLNLNSCSWAERTADNTCQYSASNCSSCGSEEHACGPLLSGIVWSIRNQLMATHPTDYQSIVNRLVLNSIKYRASPTIDPALASEFLQADDDDVDPNNGTPHRAEICAGFAAHGIQCPPLPGPCASFCNNPMHFTWNGSYQSGNLGMGTVCRETTHPVAGGNCGNLAGSRHLYVNGKQMTCNNQNWSSVPAPVSGGYCVTTTAGNYPWAFFTLW